MNDTSQHPWKTWSFNEQFFTELGDWNTQNPETTLDLVLAGVCDAIDSTVDIRSLIPNSPFPAGNLIEGLCQLITLGRAIRSAKRDVHNFVKEIGKWVSREAVAYQQARPGRDPIYMTKTWENLAEIHDLIEEICAWAAERLNDGLGNRIRHSLFVGKEISNFKARINDALSRFMHLSVINIAEGQDQVIEKIRICTELLQGEGQALLDIIDRFEHESRIQLIKSTIGSRLAVNTSYVDQSKVFCAEGTRLEILRNLNDWIQDLSDDAASFTWLTGPPGSGKSCILASLCRQLKDAHMLWAHYFFNRNYTSTLDPNSLFPTIALQLANFSPDIALLICETLTEKPSLVDIISTEQADALFVKPLTLAALQLRPFEPIVIALDALDESNTRSLSQLASILSDAFTRLPNNVKIILSSRVESPIQTAFACIPCRRLLPLWQVDLQPSNDASMQDVELVLRRDIMTIAVEFSLNPVQWPGEQQLHNLCEQASGLFIWAVTAVSFIREKLTVSIIYRDSVVEQLLQHGMDDINKLYKTILDNMYPKGTDDLVLRYFRRIVGVIAVLSEPLRLFELAGLLEDEGENNIIVRQPIKMGEIILHIVRQFRTVLVAGTDIITDHTIPQLHKSFFEFITSSQLDPCFRVDKIFANKEVALRCLHHFYKLRDPWSHRRVPDRPLIKYLHASISSYDAFLTDGDADPMGDMERAQHFHSLAVALLFRAGGATIDIPDDLDRALTRCMNALSIVPADESNPQSLAIVDTLCDILLHIFRCIRRHTESVWVAKFEYAIQLIPEVHRKYSNVLSALGWLLSSFRDITYLDRSITLHRKAIQLYETHTIQQSTYSPPSDVTCFKMHAHRISRPQVLTKSLFLRYLGSALVARFNLSSDLDDVDQSISAFEESLHLLSGDALNMNERISLLLYLSHPLSLRITANRSFNGPDLERTLSLFQDVLQSSTPALLARKFELQDTSSESVSYDPDLRCHIVLLPQQIQDGFSGYSSTDYLQALASIRNDHPDKPMMIARLYDHYPSNSPIPWYNSDLLRSPDFSPSPEPTYNHNPWQQPKPLHKLNSLYNHNPWENRASLDNPNPLDNLNPWYNPDPWYNPYPSDHPNPSYNRNPWHKPDPSYKFDKSDSPDLPFKRNPWGSTDSVYDRDPILIKKKISALQLAILFLRKCGYTKRRTSGCLWKYSATAQYNNQHPEEQERLMSLQLLQLIAHWEHRLFIEQDIDWGEGHIEIKGELDEDLFEQVVCRDTDPVCFPWGTGDLFLADLEIVRCGPILDGTVNDPNPPNPISEKDESTSWDTNMTLTVSHTVNTTDPLRTITTVPSSTDHANDQSRKEKVLQSHLLSPSDELSTGDTFFYILIFASFSVLIAGLVRAFSPAFS